MKVKRVLKGGTFYNDARYLSVTQRFSFKPMLRYRNFGFRLVIRGQT